MLLSQKVRRCAIGKAFEWARLDGRGDADECNWVTTRVSGRFDRHCSYTGAQWLIKHLSGGKVRIAPGQLAAHGGEHPGDVAEREERNV